MKTKTTLSTLTFFILLLVPFVGTAADYLPMSNAKVVSVGGYGATIERGGQSLKVSKGMLIEEGDVLKTSRAKVGLVFKNGSTLEAKAGTTLGFETLRQAAFPSSVKGSFGELDGNPSESVTVLKLVSGDLVGHVKKLRDVAPASRFEVATDVAVAGIRGTIYAISYKKVGDTFTYTITNVDGTVDVTPTVTVDGSAGSLQSVSQGIQAVISGGVTEEGTIYVEVDEAATSPAPAAIISAITSSVSDVDEGSSDVPTTTESAPAPSVDLPVIEIPVESETASERG